MIRVPTFALCAVAGGLMTVVAWEVGAFAPPTRMALPPPHVAVAMAQPATVPDSTSEWVATILARPLFTPDRRPPTDAVIARGDHMPDGLPRLSGVLVGPFGRRAIFAGENGKPAAVSEGGHIAAWTVLLIEAGAVQVAGPGGSRTVRPSFQPSPPESSRAAATGQRIGLPQRQ
jgi:hypothetical protein